MRETAFDGRTNQFAVIDYWPTALGPFDRREESFSSQLSELSVLLSDAQHDHPPLSIFGLYKVGVSSSLNDWIRTIMDEGIDPIGSFFEGAKRMPTSGDPDLMIRASTSVRGNQVIPYTSLVYMRPFSDSWLDRRNSNGLGRSQTVSSC